MQRFLVIQLARFGDLVQSVRLVRTLEGRGELHLLVDASLASLARLLYPHAAVHAIRAHADGISGAEVLEVNAPVFAELAAAKYDRVYNLNYSGLNYAVARLFDPAAVRGYVSLDAQAAKDPRAQMAFRWTRSRRTAGINLVDHWAWLAGDPIAPEAVNPEAEPRGGGVGVVLAGRNQRRSLPGPVLAKVASAVRSANGRGPLILLGGPGERQAGERLAAAFPANLRGEVVNLAEKTDYSGLREAVSGLDRLVTPDTGTMHLAAFLGVPVTAFFLSSAWAPETGPYGLGHTVWQATADCAPCLESASCPVDTACREPFAGRELLRAVATGGQGCPRGVVGLDSGFDELGLVFSPFCNELPEQATRDAFRNFYRRHLGLRASPAGPLDAELAARLYVERDWMAEPDTMTKVES